MIGKYEIQIYNNKVHYHLTVKRNITIFQGDSILSDYRKAQFINILKGNYHQVI